MAAWQRYESNAMSKRWPTSVERAQREILPLSLALYHAARDYPGGSKAIAAVHGVPHSTLQHKLSPTSPQHRPGIEDLEFVLSATQDPRILDAICDQVPGAYWFKVNCDDDLLAPEPNLLGAIAGMASRVADLVDGIAKHRSDGTYDSTERAELKLLATRLFSAIGRVTYEAQEFD